MNHALLIFENGPQPGRQVPIEAAFMRLGRAADNDLVLEDDAVTAHHARIDARRNRYRVVDLGSLNGTFVNNARVQLHELQDGDHLQLGRLRLRFSRPESSEALEIAGADLESADSSAILRRYRTTTPVPRDPRILLTLHEHLRTVLELTERIGGLNEEAPVLDHGIDLLERVCSPDRIVFLLRDAGSDVLTPVRSHPSDSTLTLSEAILREVVHAKRAIRIVDAQADQRFGDRRSVVAGHIRSVLCVPLRSDTDVIGVCYLDRIRSDVPFRPEHLELATLVANVLGQRLEHIRLYQDAVQVETLKVVNREMAETNARLRELEQFKTDMVNMLVHDMKGAVATTMLSLDIMNLNGEESLPLETREHLRIAKRNQHKLNEMIMNLLETTKLEEGRLTPQWTDVRMRTFCDELMETAAPYGQGQEVAVQCETPHDLTLRTDKRLLERMVLNLVFNAINHSEPGSEVAVSVEAPAAGMITIGVRDRGEGIPPELHDRIFDKFAQAETRALGMKSDVGLGLAFCKLAAETLGGRISLHSARGAGSTFTLHLPNPAR